MPKGGNVYASSKNIAVFNFISETQTYANNRYSWIDLLGGVMTHAYGAEILRNFLPLLFSIKRSYLDIRDVTEFTIDDQGQMTRKEAQ